MYLISAFKIEYTFRYLISLFWLLIGLILSCIRCIFDDENKKSKLVERDINNLKWMNHAKTTKLPY